MFKSWSNPNDSHHWNNLCIWLYVRVFCETKTNKMFLCAQATQFFTSLLCCFEILSVRLISPRSFLTQLTYKRGAVFGSGPWCRYHEEGGGGGVFHGQENSEHGNKLLKKNWSVFILCMNVFISSDHLEHFLPHIALSVSCTNPTHKHKHRLSDTIKDDFLKAVFYYESFFSYTDSTSEQPCAQVTWKSESHLP